jgi:hypothetical protein
VIDIQRCPEFLLSAPDEKIEQCISLLFNEITTKGKLITAKATPTSMASSPVQTDR